MIVRTLISLPWVVLSYSNDSSREFIIPYSYFFSTSWCWYGPRSHLRGRMIGYVVWGQAPESVTITQFCFLLVNHLIMWRIYITVILMTWKQGWIYGRGWMWFQWSMESLLSHFTWRCGSVSLFLGLPSSEIMWYGILMICWCGLVLVPNRGFIKWPYTP